MPSTLKDARAAKPTRPMPHYISDGSGRDVIIAFSGDPNPPHFNVHSENRPHHLPSGAKRGIGKTPVAAKFVPDGSGRDMFQQQNNDYVFPIYNSTRGEATSPKQRQVSYYNRPKASPKFKPSGTGRDMSYSNIDVYQTITSQNSFRTLKPSPSNGLVLRPRTSPPPRFVSSGSGRDTFQNPSAYRPASSYNSQREGFHYGSQSISNNARYKFGKSSKTGVSQGEAMKRLCSSGPTNRAKSASAVRRDV